MSSSEVLSSPPETESPALDGKFRIRISRDAYEVFLDELTPPSGGGKPVTSSQIFTKLKKLKVHNGIDRAAIDKALVDAHAGLLAKAAASGELKIVIARGRAARDGADGVLEWASELKAPNTVRVVRPQQVVARYTPATAGESGVDVHGNKTRARDGVDSVLSTGAGVVFTVAGETKEFTALFYGRAELNGGVLSVDSGVAVTPDKMAVTMTLHPLDDEAVTLPHVIDTLAALGIRHGIDQDLIEKTLIALNHGRQAQANVVVATGMAAVDEQPATLAWRIPLSTIRTGMAIARRGDILVEVTEPIKGATNGRNVFGDELPAKKSGVVVPRAGAGIEVTEKDAVHVHLAKCYGRIVYDKDALSIDTPLYVESDRMKASMDVYDVYKASSAKDARAISAEDLLDALSVFGVVFGVQAETIDHALKHLAGSNALLLKRVVVAKGKPAVDGVDESLALVDRVSSGKVLENGRIDFHDHNYPVNVTSGAVVARRVAAVPAQDGCDVLGNRIEGRPPKALELVLEGVEEQAGGELVAARDGALLLNNGTLTVADLLAVEGDVGPATGNIDAKLSVQIKGHVVAGFHVKASGDVVVKQNIEQARVDVGGSLVVHGGIRGGQTQVHVKNGLQAQFIELARIRVEGDVAIGKGLVNCDLQAGGTVRIGDPSKGTIMGGRVRAQSGITAAVLGSPACVKTQVELEFPSALVDALAAVKAQIDKKKTNLAGLEALDAKCAVSDGQGGNETCRKIGNTVDVIRDELEAAQRERDGLINTLTEMKKTRVRVLRRVFPGVQIKLFGVVTVVDKELGPGEFYLKGDEIAFEAR